MVEDNDEHDIRSALEEAMEEKPSEQAPEKPEVAEPEATEKKQPEDKKEVSTGEEPDDAEESVEAATEEKPEEDSKPVKSALKAPASWKAGAKERWSSLTPDVQEEILRRERESATAIQRNAEGRQFAETFHKAIDPYRAVMAAEGTTDPIVAVQNLMQTATTLRLGTPVQKADLIARLINIYGVDVQTLDGILSGQADPKITQQQEIDRLLQERLAPYQQFMQQQQMSSRQNEQRIQQQAESVVDDFAAKNEFVDDPEISNTMADLLELSARRGRAMDIQEAYDRAVQMNPEISRIVEQRKAASSTKDVERSRAAAKSVKGSPMGGSPLVDTDDIRATLTAAFDGKI
jgi:hypothetical protein